MINAIDEAIALLEYIVTIIVIENTIGESKRTRKWKR
jgi:hypothetical protein